MSTWQEFVGEIKVSEGSVPHMYLDTVGKVTVGVGNMLPNVAAAQNLPFLVRGSLEKATKDQIKLDYESVSKQTMGRIAHHYRASTKLDLPEHEIHKLLEARIDAFRRELELRFLDFDTYPITVQFALMDMAFNLGTHGVVTKFPTFTKAIKAKDWAKAARESRRPQVGGRRNKTVQDWLEAAVEGPMGDWNLPRDGHFLALSRAAELGGHRRYGRPPMAAKWLT